jgi:hypothetical protein
MYTLCPEAVSFNRPISSYQQLRGAISVLYLHAVKVPLFAEFNTPQKYGLARELLCSVY